MSKTKEEVLEPPPEAAEPAADKDPKTAPEPDIAAAAAPDAADATEDAEEA